MRRSHSRNLLRFLPFAAVTLAAAPAFARDSVDEIATEVFSYLGDIRPLHLFAAACVFLVIGVFAKARESSGLVIFGSFFMTAVCVAAFIIFALTGDLMDKHRMRPHVAKTEPAAEAPKEQEKPKEKEPDVVNANAKVGDKCHRNSDCNQGTVCAKVAGSRNCWSPCTSGGQCDPGFACMSDTNKEMVCVR